MNLNTILLIKIFLAILLFQDLVNIYILLVILLEKFKRTTKLNHITFKYY